MNSTVFLVLRIVFGLALLFFGGNKLFHFVDPPPPPEVAQGYWEALLTTRTLTLVAIVEVLSGLSLLINKYGALMMLILMSISVNAVLYHVSLDRGGIVMGLILLVLNIVMLYGYKERYQGILTA